MSTALPVDQLLAGIEGDQPAGAYLKEDRSSYRPLRNAYNVAQTALRKLTSNPDPEELDDLQQDNIRCWQELSSLLQEVIRSRSKDLECMSWLALTQLFTADPFANLAVSLNLIQQTLEQFGEQVHPRVPDSKLRASDEDGRRAERATLQLKPLAQLFGESEESCLLGLPLRMQPLVGDIDFLRWRSADRQGNRQELQQEARQALAEHQSEVVQRVLALDDIVQAQEQLDQTLARFAQESGGTPVNSRFFKDQLSASLNAIRALTEGVLVPWPLDARQQQRNQQAAAESQSEENEEQQNPELAEDTGSGTGQGVVSGRGEPIYNRDQAFQQLRLIADYFARTEPQSPVSSMIEKVIRWGYTPLPELIGELIQGHEGMMGRITELTGMSAERVHIPGTPARELVPPPQETPLAPSQRGMAARPATVPAAVSYGGGVQPAPPSVKESVVSDSEATSTASPKKAATAPKGEEGARPAQGNIPSFVNLTSREERKSETRKPSGPGGVDLASLGVRN